MLGAGVVVLTVVGSALAGCGSDAGDDAGRSGADGGGQPTTEWLRLGYDLANSRAAVGETTVGPDNVGDLVPSWELTGVAGLTGTPVVAGGVVYVGDWQGHVRALDAATGEERWDRDVEGRYIGGAVALDDSRVFAGTLDGRVVALDRDSGEVGWETRVDEHPMAAVFGSPIVVDDLVLVGVGSYEVFAAGDRPSFRGSVVALDAATGDEVWRFWMTAGDETEGPGVSVWSSAAVDRDRGHLYIGTGQAYAPPAPPRSDAVVALEIETGREVWATQFTAGDAWTSAQPTGRDADVGGVPNLFEADGVDAVGVGDKDGVYRALDRDTGELLWERRLTEGGLQGGVMASAAVADGRIYVTSNDGSQAADLVALDTASGEEAWRVGVEAHVTGPVTWANGVVYVADDSGRISGFAAEEGERLWSHEVASPAAGGIAVVDGTVYAGWGWWLAGAPENPQGGLIAFRPDGNSGGTASGSDGEAGDEGVSGGDAGAGVGEEGDDSGDEPAEGAELGEQVYVQSCASCHGGSGEGGSGPPIVGIADRLSPEEHLEIVREGRAEMPGWDETLTPEEIEAVVEYQRAVLTEAP